MTLEEIMRDVTPPETWQRKQGAFKNWLVVSNSKSGREQIFETTVYNDEHSEHLDFVLRAAKNFAPLVKALEEMITAMEQLNKGHHREVAVAKLVLAEALRKAV